MYVVDGVPSWEADLSCDLVARRSHALATMADESAHLVVLDRVAVAVPLVEDPDREPDGFPHYMMAATALLVIGTVALVFVALLSKSIPMTLSGLVLLFVIAIGLLRKAARLRDVVRSSR